MGAFDPVKPWLCEDFTPLRMKELKSLGGDRGQLTLCRLRLVFRYSFGLVRFICRSLALLLIHPGLRDSDCQCPDSRDHSDALGHGNCSAGVEDVEQMRALQTEIVGGQNREIFNGLTSHLPLFRC